MFRSLLIGLAFCALGTGAAANSLVGSPSYVIQGTVTDTDGQPIIGASVTILSSGKAIAGTATNNRGKFSIDLKSACTDLEIKVSSVGYAGYRETLDPGQLGRPVVIVCQQESVELHTITVTPAPEFRQDLISIPAKKITSLSSRSLVVTNATAAVQHPQIAKVGSAHSSQIRINGTAPAFHLNGVPIGTDPNHFGMFSVVPAPIVDHIEFHPQGTDASYAVPSVINFATPLAFERASATQLSFSTLEITGTLRRSTDRHYLIASGRKSILDHLINSFDIKSDRQAIPPTSFSDLFVSFGTKLSSHWQAGVDQYHVGDYLSFNTSQTTDGASSVQTYQKTREHYVGLRLNGLYGKTLITATLATRSGDRAYQATPEDDTRNRGLRIDLNERYQSYLGHLQARLESGQWEFKTGTQFDFDPNRHVVLDQQNWNFQPPFATSDNPYIYQNALNKLYGHYDATLSRTVTQSYLSISRAFGPLSLSGGLRHAAFSHLASDALVPRMSIGFQTGATSGIKAVFGDYATDPVSAILDPNQVLIHEFASDLRPVKTRLISLEYLQGPAKLNVFDKRITDMPVISPDFTVRYGSIGHVDPDVIRMRSEGAARFVGGSLSLDLPRFLSPRLSVYGSYAYTHATVTDHGVTYPYDVNAEHRLQTQFEYKLSRKVTLGSEMLLRSGYRYSPTRGVLAYSEPSTYNEDHYRATLSKENSLQFSPNAALNLYAAFTFGDATLNLAITNATNRYNPIIHSPSGYVYDAGILPSIGFRWNL